MPLDKYFYTAYNLIFQILSICVYFIEELSFFLKTGCVFWHKMRPVKRLIAKRAAEFIKNDMTIFIDGTTTTHYIGEYLKDFQNLTVITNNINLASHLSESGIKAICLGGTIIEPPYMTGGSDTANQAKSYSADIVFFSATGVSADGKIFLGSYLELIRAMIGNSAKSVF